MSKRSQHRINLAIVGNGRISLVGGERGSLSSYSESSSTHYPSTTLMGGRLKPCQLTKVILHVCHGHYPFGYLNGPYSIHKMTNVPFFFSSLQHHILSCTLLNQKSFAEQNQGIIIHSSVPFIGIGTLFEGLKV